MTAKITRRSVRFIFALGLAVLLYGCGPPPAVPETGPETLPALLTDQEFWSLITEFSEPGGYFPSDNFLSDEVG